jgi:hypothetical protein
MAFSCVKRSGAAKPWIRTALMLSRLESTTSCSSVATSRMFPGSWGLAGRYCAAVMPNRATLSRSAPLAYTATVCALVSWGGQPFLDRIRVRASFAMFFLFRQGKIAIQRNYDCFDPW